MLAESLKLMMNKTLWHSWLWCLVAMLITTPLCIAYFDRPLAVFFTHQLIDTGYFKFVVWLIRPLAPIYVVVLMTLLAGGIRVLSGGELPRRLRPLLVPAIAIAMALGVELVMKTFFARSEIWPTYMKENQYGFDWLHYRDGWRSFPSGTAMGLFALVGVLFVYRSRWSLAVLYASLVICALVTIVTYHWLSDVIVGIFVGLTIGYATGTLLSPLIVRDSLQSETR